MKALRPRMSAIGPKRTSLVALHMSALGGKADMIAISAIASPAKQKTRQRWPPRKTLAAQLRVWHASRNSQLIPASRKRWTTFTAIRHCSKARSCVNSDWSSIVVGPRFTLPAVCRSLALFSDIGRPNRRIDPCYSFTMTVTYQLFGNSGPQSASHPSV